MHTVGVGMRNFANPSALILRSADSFVGDKSNNVPPSVVASSRSIDELSYLRSPSFANMSFTSTEQVDVCSDARGNMFINQYVVVKDLGRGAFGKVRHRLPTLLDRLNTRPVSPILTYHKCFFT